MTDLSSLNNFRIRTLNDAPVRKDRDYVLYWMVAYRRPFYNFALEHAVSIAQKLNSALVILEPLRIDYPWSSERHHRFIIDGMYDNIHAFDKYKVNYYPYLERKCGEGKGLLATLAKRANYLISDDFPTFFLPNAMAAAAKQVDIRFDIVDSNGLLPMRQSQRYFTTAASFRRALQKETMDCVMDFPAREPLENLNLPQVDLPKEIVARWPMLKRDEIVDLSRFTFNEEVSASAFKGGFEAATQRWNRFVNTLGLERYGEGKDPPKGCTGLSPYLHFGHISTHQLLSDIFSAYDWSPSRLAPKATGSKEGFWGLPSRVEVFIDELVTWREIGFNACVELEDYDRYESLPNWARQTLAAHQSDPRPYCYTLEAFDHAQTHDPLWNAIQNQLVREGRIYNYLRMLWGKKILHWSKSPQDALATMIELNNRYALDGRDPNSYSGIFWVLGRYDRAWGPERPIFGKIRYMTSDSTLKKLHLKPYIETYKD